MCNTINSPASHTGFGWRRVSALALSGIFSVLPACAGDFPSNECLQLCSGTTMSRNTDRLGEVVHAPELLTLTAEIIRGVAPGLRIILKEGGELYLVGSEVHAIGESAELMFPTGLFKRATRGGPYVRVDQSPGRYENQSVVELEEVAEVHLVGLRGFSGLRGEVARSFLRSLAAVDLANTKDALLSMFDAADESSFSLYVGDRSGVLVRYPASHGLDAPWRYQSLIDVDFSPAYKEFRTYVHEQDSPRREDIWVLDGDEWRRLRDVVGVETGHREQSGTVYFLLITDDFRSGEVASNRKHDRTAVSNEYGDENDDNGLARELLKWLLHSSDAPTGRETPRATSYLQQFVGLWTTVGGDIHSILTSKDIDRATFYSRSRISGKFILLNDVQNLDGESELNKFLGAFAQIPPMTMPHLLSGNNSSPPAVRLADSFLSDRNIDADPRARVVILDDPAGLPCAGFVKHTLPGPDGRNFGVEVSMVKGFLSQGPDKLLQLVSAAFHNELEGVDKCT